MKLTPEQRASAGAILKSNDESFLHLLRVAGLDPRRVLPGADLRDVVFTEHDDLTGLDLSGCDLRGADLTRAVGVYQAGFADVITDGRTKGVPPPGPPADFDMDEVHAMIFRGEAPPPEWRPYVLELDLRFTFGLPSHERIARSMTDSLDPHVLEHTTSLRPSRFLRHRARTITSTELTNIIARRVYGFRSDKQLAPIAGLSALRALDLSGNRFDSLRPIAGLSALQHLNLDSTNVSDLTPIADFSVLQQLNLRRTNVIDLTPIAGLSSLEFLDLGGTLVRNLTPISNLPKLRRLRLSKGRGYRGLAALRKRGIDIDTE